MEIVYKATDLRKKEVIAIVKKLPEYFVPASYALILKSLNNNHSIGAFKENKLVGFLIWRELPDNIVELEWMCVTPELQGKGIGKELTNQIIRKKEGKVFILYTGTSDSNIPHTRFNPLLTEKCFKFFTKNGFRIIKKHHKKWSETNHAWEWVYNPRIYNIFSNNNHLAKLGIIIRPILVGLIKNLNIKEGIVGICFNVSDYDPIFFAEKICNPTPIKKMMVQEYTLTRQSTFVSRLISYGYRSFFDFNINDAVFDKIKNPLKEEFGEAVDKVKVHLIGLNKKKCIFYIITDKNFEKTNELDYAIRAFKDTLSDLIQQVLFYVRWKENELSNIIPELISYLPNEQDEYSDIQDKLAQLLVHPLSRILSDIDKENKPKILDNKSLAFPNEKRLLKNIKGFKKISIIEKFSGSFQGKSIFKIKATSTESDYIEYDSVGSTPFLWRKILPNFYVLI